MNTIHRLIVSIAAFSVIGCGIPESQSLVQGATSSAGLREAAPMYACYTPNIADAGYNVSITKLGDEVTAKVGEVWFGGIRNIESYAVSPVNDSLTHFKGESFELIVADLSTGRSKFTALHNGEQVQDELICNLVAVGRETRAVKVSMFGTGPAIDPDAYQLLNQTIGTFVGKGLVKKYIVYGYGIEGGSASCIERSPFASDEEFQQFIHDLQAIQPNPSTTSYQLELNQTCPAE